MLYSVSYDLRKPGADYDSLYNALEGLGARRVLESEWVLRHDNTTASKLRDYLMQFIDQNDRLLVIAIQNWASFNTMTDINQV